MFVHTYIVLGMGKGALYEIIAMRDLGATRAEIMETVRLGALHGGPRGINALAEVADEYLRDWHEDPATESRVAWPAGWAPDAARFRSGIDLGSDELEPGELELLRDWYLRTLGEVPPHVELPRSCRASVAEDAARAIRDRNHGCAPRADDPAADAASQRDPAVAETAAARRPDRAVARRAARRGGRGAAVVRRVRHGPRHGDGDGRGGDLLEEWD